MVPEQPEDVREVFVAVTDELSVTGSTESRQLECYVTVGTGKVTSQSQLAILG